MPAGRILKAGDISDKVSELNRIGVLRPRGIFDGNSLSRNPFCSLGDQMECFTEGNALATRDIE
jgi:hypothetical protein